jgi:hypothetical protein
MAALSGRRRAGLRNPGWPLSGQHGGVRAGRAVMDATPTTLGPWRIALGAGAQAAPPRVAGAGDGSAGGPVGNGAEPYL